MIRLSASLSDTDQIYILESLVVECSRESVIQEVTLSAFIISDKEMMFLVAFVCLLATLLKKF